LILWRLIYGIFRKTSPKSPDWCLIGQRSR
jgi:hypothetical protein